MVSGSGGGTGVTTYAENMGVMAITRIYSTALFIAAAIIAILLGFSPKFGALILTIPGPVLGGLSIVVFGLIAATAGRIWVENRVDFSDARNLITVAVALVLGAGNFKLSVARLHARRHRHRDVRLHHSVSPAERGTGEREDVIDAARAACSLSPLPLAGEGRREAAGRGRSC